MNKKSLSKLGDKNPAWKGENVGYTQLHKWIRAHKKKSKLCEMCKEKPPFDIANISGEYKRDIDDFRWLCRRCHQLSDGRLDAFAKMARLKDKKGDNHPRAKLNTWQVKRMRLIAEISPSLSRKYIAKIFNISHSHTVRIINRKVWTHI